MPLAPPAPFDQLRSSFATLHAAVREKIAAIVGVVVADVVRRAVHGVLDRSTTPPVAAKPVPQGPDDGWWDDEPDEVDEEFDDRDETTEPPKPANSNKPSQLAAAVTLGVQAATWWSRKFGGRTSAMRIAAVGVIATAGAYLLGPLAVVAGVALSVLSLADAAESATAFLS